MFLEIILSLTLKVKQLLPPKFHQLLPWLPQGVWQYPEVVSVTEADTQIRAHQDRRGGSPDFIWCHCPLHKHTRKSSSVYGHPTCQGRPHVVDQDRARVLMTLKSLVIYLRWWWRQFISCLMAEFTSNAMAWPWGPPNHQFSQTSSWKHARRKP